MSNSTNTTEPSYMTLADNTDATTTDSDPRANLPNSGVAIDDPSATVAGQTLTQWTEQWYRWAVPTPAIPTPGGPIDAFSDPNGILAAAFNRGFSPMYFITGDADDTRTFYVLHGESVLVPIVAEADSEGPGIMQTSIPGFTGSPADRVKAVLAMYTFTNTSYQLDGGKTVTNLPVINSGIFNAGFAPPGSAGAAFFEVTAHQGALLQTTGEEGCWVALTGLSPGQHNLTAGGTITYQGTPHTYNFHEIINVT